MPAKKADLMFSATSPKGNKQPQTLEEKIAEIHKKGVEWGGLLKVRLMDAHGESMFVDVSANLQHATEFLLKQVEAKQVFI